MHPIRGAFARLRVVNFGLLALLLLWILTPYLQINGWLFDVLQDRFAPPEKLGHVDGIVVLGGGGAERLRVPIELARRFPSARIVLSGGGGIGERDGFTEARAIHELMVRSGLDPRRLILEERARSTYENAVLSHKMVAPKPNETWILVTSAYHMPRAVGCFRKIEWAVVPYPVDQRAPEYIITVHEWLGLIMYYLSGRIDTLLPGP